MSNETKENEEVDLGSLFVILGKGFKNLFHFFGTLFKNLFHFLIQILLFLKSNIIKLSIATVVGALIGVFIEFKSETKYEGNLYVKPNFSSSRQLYNNIQFYNDLVKQKNNVLLASIFKISPEDAKSLKTFAIQPVINENDILTSYDDLTQSIDSLTVKSYSYIKFQNAFTKFDYKIHEISVTATKNNVFEKLSTSIISSIINNDYFKNLKKINKANLLRTDALLKKNLEQADSLHYVYKKVLIEESKKSNSGTSIDLGNNDVKSSNRELKLFEANLELNESLIDVNKDLSEKSEVINIVSNFQPIGHKVKEIKKNKIFQLGLLGFSFMVVFLLLIKLNYFLNNYKN